MTIHTLKDQPSAEHARLLEDFESRFSYPLGPGRSFKLSHGVDYPRFFRAMGNARSFVAKGGGQVLGALSVAIRPIFLPDGTRQETAYVGDLKCHPDVAGSFTFLRLALAAIAWGRPQVSSAYGVVMDGTRASPTQYTGRLGIPAFGKLGKIFVLRFPTELISVGCCQPVDDACGTACYRSLIGGRYTPLGGNPAERSEMEAVWLIHPEGLACGRLEDTRRAKRLIGSDGIEMQSTHLACFASKTPAAGAELIHAGRLHARQCGLPAMFVSVPECDFPALNSALGMIDKVIAPATIYGVGLPGGGNWNISSSEI